MYDAAKAVAYAHRWAFERNPRWGVFDEMGGDCANFVSQCLFAGCGVMNVPGWFYVDLAHRSPAWTGVQELRRFLLTNRGRGPWGQAGSLQEASAGDVIFLELDQGRFSHSALVVQGGPGPAAILLAAHTRDCDNRPLISYPYRQASLVRIIGAGG